MRPLLLAALLACCAAPILAGDGGASGGSTILVATATYNPASLAAGTTRCDTVTVSGITTGGGAVVASPGSDISDSCVIAAVRASAANTVTVCWRNVIATITACDPASSTWTFSQPR